MSTEWLFYWRKEQIRRAVSRQFLYHAASDQFDVLHPNDVLWICGEGSHDKLVTIGSFVVDEIVDLEEAKRRLPFRPFNKRYHALAKAGKMALCQEVSLAQLVASLRFESRDRDRVDLSKPL